MERGFGGLSGLTLINYCFFSGLFASFAGKLKNIRINSPNLPDPRSDLLALQTCETYLKFDTLLKNQVLFCLKFETEILLKL